MYQTKKQLECMDLGPTNTTSVTKGESESNF